VVTVVGVCRAYDAAEGRALGYAAFVVP
jgi:hypothetical protein